MTRNSSTFWNSLGAWLRQGGNLPEDEPELRVFADRTYTHLVKWFGQPVDPKKPYVLIRGRKWSQYTPGWKCHLLVISDRCVTREQRFAAVAHEMFHRVSWGKGGYRRYLLGQAWLEELLACQACEWVLEEEKLPYAVTHRRWYLRQDSRVDTRKLRIFHSLFFQACLYFNVIYPKHFYNSVERLGYALQAVVGKEQLSRLAQSRSLSEWIESLPTELQGQARYLLGYLEQKPSLNSADAHHRFGFALAAIGDKEEAIAEAQAAIHLQPDQPRFYYTLASAYYDLGRLDEAISSWKIAAELTTTDADAPCNIASALVSQGKGEEAVTWFHEATRRQPERAMLQFYFGKALAETGDWTGARTAWDRVLTLGDEQYAKWTREALETIPTP